MAAEASRLASVAAPPVEDERTATATAAAAPVAATTAATPAAAASADDGDGSALVLSVAAHPRAARRVAESKAWGGVAGFLAGGYLSLANHTPVDAAFRALATGVVCYVLVWAAAVFVWSRLVVAELRERERELLNGELARREAAVGGGVPGGGVARKAGGEPGAQAR